MNEKLSAAMDHLMTAFCAGDKTTIDAARKEYDLALWEAIGWTQEIPAEDGTYTMTLAIGGSGSKWKKSGKAWYSASNPFHRRKDFPEGAWFKKA